MNDMVISYGFSIKELAQSEVSRSFSSSDASSVLILSKATLSDYKIEKEKGVQRKAFSHIIYPR